MYVHAEHCLREGSIPGFMYGVWLKLRPGAHFVEGTQYIYLPYMYM